MACKPASVAEACVRGFEGSQAFLCGAVGESAGHIMRECSMEPAMAAVMIEVVLPVMCRA